MIRLPAIALGLALSGGAAPGLESFEITDEQREHWAFQPVERPAGDIDSIIDAALAAEGLAANPPATRGQLIRRAWFDLVGLAPDFEEIRAFEDDPAPTDDAFAALVDRLLAMPEYGERWGRHWLDVVRYAQTNGYERDDEKPNAWRYRDYVIEAFNDDRRYDRFILEQLAGDELPDGGRNGLIATGFYRLGVWDDEPDDKTVAEFDGFDDMLRATTESFLGLTAGCARCHHHMFDPVSQTDYYQLLAFFRNVRGYAKPGEATLRDIDGGQALCVTENGPRAPDTHVLIRGEVGRTAAKVEPRLPEVFGDGAPEIAPTENSSGRRTALAKWIASPDNPLTARVMVNRIWQGHFGRGIVATPNDFGAAGEPPASVPLLDWLAAEFVESGWSVKHLHRVIMNTRAYRRSSAPAADNEKIDPGNLLHWRANLRRLEAETLRDRILQASGALNPKRGGPSFYPALSGEVVAGASRPGRGWGWSPPEEQNRRSVYAFVKRTMVYPFFEIFDYANTEGSLGARPQTTVAPQALLLLNSELVAAESLRLAGQLLDEGDPVGGAFRRIFGRRPDDSDRALAERFLNDQLAAQREMSAQLVFRPDYPPALFNEYQRLLPAERFLRGPGGAWEAFKGKWTGDYEGIVNAEPGWPPYRLFRAATRDVTVSGRVRLDPIAKRAAILLRATPKGDNLDGYVALIDAEQGHLEFRRYRDGKFDLLARHAPYVPSAEFVDFEARLVGDRFDFKVAGGGLGGRDRSPIDGAGRVGISAWGGPVTFDGLSLILGGKVYPLADVDPERSDLAPAQPGAAPEIVVAANPDRIGRRALAELCSTLMNTSEFLYVD